MTEGKEMAEAVDREGLRVLRQGVNDRHHDWARENGVRVPPNVLYDMRGRGRHYRRSGERYLETSLFVNRDGFEKKFEIEADVSTWTVPTVVRISSLKPLSPTECAKAILPRLLFVRTLDKSPDGMAIFREDGYL